MTTQDFAALYKKYYNGILGYFLRNFNRNMPLAEDLAQDTFAKILSHSKSHIDFLYSKQYIYKVAENVKYDHIRRGKGIITIDIDNVISPLLFEYPDYNYAQDYITMLHPAERMLFELMKEGYNSFELAKIFNITPSAVRARLSKLKKTICKMHNNL